MIYNIYKVAGIISILGIILILYVNYTITGDPFNFNKKNVEINRIEFSGIILDKHINDSYSFVKLKSGGDTIMVKFPPVKEMNDCFDLLKTGDSIQKEKREGSITIINKNISFKYPVSGGYFPGNIQEYSGVNINIVK